MVKTKFKPTPFNNLKRRKTRTKPDLSMSIKEIMLRFTRGLPLPPDLNQRTPIYDGNTEYDLEKLSRADFSEKHEFAQQMRERAASIKGDYQEQLKERAKQATKKATEKEPEQQQQSAKKQAEQGEAKA